MSYAKLKGRIYEVFGSVGAFANAMGKDASTMSLKLNGKIAWKREEIELACSVLDIPVEQIHLYFFNKKVEISQTEEE